MPSARAPLSRDANGRRELPLEASSGPGKTSLEPGEMLVSILLPPPLPRSAAKYLRFTPRREMDIAIAGAGAWLRLDADGDIAEARIVLASVGPTPMRAPTAEQKLEASGVPALFEAAGRPPPAMRDPSPIRAARPTIAGRWWPC